MGYRVSAAGDLAAALETGLADLYPAGAPPVRPPGSPVGSLPCVQIVPGDDRLDGPVLLSAYDVTVCVPRAEAVEQLEQLEQLAGDVLFVLLEAGYSVGSRLRYYGGDTEDVHYLARVIPVEAARKVVC